jgi:hypothetical protein
LVAVYRVHPTKPVRHRYPVCSVSVRIVIARKSETRHGITYIYIYIYITNIPPIMIINRIYETRNLLSL